MPIGIGLLTRPEFDRYPSDGDFIWIPIIPRAIERHGSRSYLILRRLARIGSCSRDPRGRARAGARALALAPTGAIARTLGIQR